MSESLAGRASILEMLGLSARELGDTEFLMPFVPSLDYTKKREQAKGILNMNSLWKRIFRGDMPELAAVPTLDATMYYDAYVNTYIRRDVRSISGVGNEAAFVRFMKAIAYQCGKQLNKATIARELGISEPTVNRWLSVLEASRIIYLLKPYSKNAKKRLVKTPKLYFTNTGLACYLCSFVSPNALMQSNLKGALFENYTISEIIKSHLNAQGVFPELYYYRDSRGTEIDLLIPTEKGLHPVEIKASSVPKQKDADAFEAIETVLEMKRLPGAVINTYESVLPLTGADLSIPVTYL